LLELDLGGVEVLMTLLGFTKYVVKGVLICTFLVGCSSDPAEPEFGFGEADMQNAIIGDWSGTMSLAGQMPTAFTLNVVQVPSLEPTCGSRPFSSPLCVESSSLTLEATLSTADKGFDAVKLNGHFTVIGLEMNNGDLWLSGTGVSIASGVDVTKSLHDLTVSGDKQGSATMQR
jgi:hypothetical protein